MNAYQLDISCFSQKAANISLLFPYYQLIYVEGREKTLAFKERRK